MSAMPSGRPEFPDPIEGPGRPRFPDPLGDPDRPRFPDPLGDPDRPRFPDPLGDPDRHRFPDPLGDPDRHRFPDPLGDPDRPRFPDPLGEPDRARPGDVIGGAARFARSLPRPRLRLRLRPALAGIALLLAGAAIVLLARVLLTAGPATTGQPIVAAATFDGVGYGLLGATARKTLPQRGASRIQASGVFDVVKLRLRSVDGRPHIVAGDLLSLDAGGTYYGVSSPSDIGLSDPQWGAIWGPMQVPAHGSINIKAIFDVPPAVLRHPLSVHIGAFDYVGQGAVTLRLSSGATCCRSAASPEILSLAPNPVLG